MIITAISDTHGKHRQLKLDSGDILIHAGDVDARFKYDLMDFLDWFSKQDYKYKIFIAGNHDFYLQETRTEKIDAICDEFSVDYLEEGEMGIPYKKDYLRIYGTPWSLPFYNWAFMKPQEELNEIYKTIPNNIDILITHSPPYGSQRGIVTAGENVGVKGLPRTPYTICGHIHEGYGSTYDAYHKTYVFNCSVLNEKYDLVNEPITFEYETNT